MPGDALRRRPDRNGHAALWGQFHRWVQDQTVDAVIIEGTRALHVRQAGAWRRLPTPFARDQQVRELLRRLTLHRRYPRGPVYEHLPEGFELFAWSAKASAQTILFLRRSGPVRPQMDELLSLMQEDEASLRLLARQLAEGRPVLVCGPGQHARERVLIALTSLLGADRRIVWLVDGQRPVSVAGAAAVVTMDGRRLHANPALAHDVLAPVLALSPEWIVVQDAPPPLLWAVAERLGPGRVGMMAGCGFPLLRRSDPARAAPPWAQSRDLPEIFRWIVEVAGYRRPMVEGIWRAVPGEGAVQLWERLPVNGPRCRWGDAPTRGAAAVPSWAQAGKAAEGPSALYAGESRAGPPS